MNKFSGSKFMKIWAGIFLLSIIALSAQALLPNKSNPSLQDVLTDKPAAKPFNASLIIASLLSVSIAALSAAKSYEIFKRNKLPISQITEAIIENESIPVIAEEQQEEAARTIQLLQDENKDFASRIKILYSEIDEVKKIEAMLRKSNIALGKECERLRTENEGLTIKTKKIKASGSSKKKKSKAK